MLLVEVMVSEVGSEGEGKAQWSLKNDGLDQFLLVFSLLLSAA